LLKENKIESNIIHSLVFYIGMFVVRDTFSKPWVYDT